MFDTANLIFDPPQWYERANCQGKSGIMFPDERCDDSEAKAICAQCTVVRECEELVLSLPLSFTDEGVWHGVGADDRRRVRGSV